MSPGRYELVFDNMEGPPEVCGGFSIAIGGRVDRVVGDMADYIAEGGRVHDPEVRFALSRLGYGYYRLRQSDSE